MNVRDGDDCWCEIDHASVFVLGDDSVGKTPSPGEEYESINSGEYGRNGWTAEHSTKPVIVEYTARETDGKEHEEIRARFADGEDPTKTAIVLDSDLMSQELSNAKPFRAFWSLILYFALNPSLEHPAVLSEADATTFAERSVTLAKSDYDNMVQYLEMTDAMRKDIEYE